MGQFLAQGDALCRLKVHQEKITPVDDATRIRALKIDEQQTQENAIGFIDYVVEKFPFRIQTVRTDNGLLTNASRKSRQDSLRRGGSRDHFFLDPRWLPPQ